jgi:hypothetical protein
MIPKLIIMKKTFSLTFFCSLLVTSSFAQKIYKDRQASMDAIKNAGSEIKFFDADKSVFYYMRYDEDGEAQVIYKSEGEIVKRIMIVVRQQSQLVKRTLNAFKTATSCTPDKDIEGVFIAIGTIYYDGKARYEGISNDNPTKFYLEIIIL